jgi:hypothetical protein
VLQAVRHGGVAQVALRARAWTHARAPSARTAQACA